MKKDRDVAAKRESRQRVTINDVASLAGVSRGAVTRALNNKSDISEETKQRVLDATQRLQYRPNRFARGFVSRNKTKSLGLVLKSFLNPFYAELASEVLAKARENDWQVVIACSEGTTEEAVLHGLVGQVDIVAGHFNLQPENLKRAAQGMPIILLEGVAEFPGVHSVGLDMESGIRDAIAMLYTGGATHIGMIDSNYSVALAGTYTASPRCELFRRLVDPQTRDAIACADETLAGGEDGLRELLGKWPDLDAIVVFNDLMAIGAMYGAFRAGYDVPSRLRILGIDGLTMGQALSPALSSILIDRSNLARKIFELAKFLDEIEFRDVPSINWTIPLKFMARQSA